MINLVAGNIVYIYYETALHSASTKKINVTIFCATQLREPRRTNEVLFSSTDNSTAVYGKFVVTFLLFCSLKLKKIVVLLFLREYNISYNELLFKSEKMI